MDPHLNSMGGAKAGKAMLPGIGILLYLILCGLALTTVTISGRQLWIAAMVLLSFPVIWYACFIKSVTETSDAVDVFQPGTIMAGTFVFYVLLPAINNWIGVGYGAHSYQGFRSESYSSVLLYCLAGLAAFGVGYRLPLFVQRQKSIMRNEIEKGELPTHRWLYVLIAAAVVGMSFKVLHFYQVGGSVRVLLEQLSPSAKRSADVSISGFQIMGESLLVWAGLILVFFYLWRISGKAIEHKFRPTMVIATLTLGLAIVEYIFTGKRSSIIFLFLLPLVWWHYLINPIKGVRAVVYGALFVLGIAVFLMARILIPVYIADEEEKRQAAAAIVGDAGAFYINSGEFATFDMMVFGFENDEMVVREMGGRLNGAYTYNLEQVALTAIPRAIWKEKPAYSDLSHVFSKLTTGSGEAIGRAVSIFGAFYAFGLWPVVIGGLFVVGVLFRFMYFKLQPWHPVAVNLFVYPVFFWLAFQYLRFGTIGFTWIYFLHSLAVGLILFLIVRSLVVLPHFNR